MQIIEQTKIQLQTKNLNQNNQIKKQKQKKLLTFVYDNQVGLKTWKKYGKKANVELTYKL